MNESTNFERILKKIREDNVVMETGETIIVKLDRECWSMLADAYRLTADGAVEPVPWQTFISVDAADSAEISLSEGDDVVVAFHLSRPSNRDHRSNGIRFHYDEFGVPCVVFVNTGMEALTVDGEWIKSGEYIAICQ